MAQTETEQRHHKTGPHHEHNLQKYKTFLEAVISDGGVTESEHIACENLRNKLHISLEEHKNLLQQLNWTEEQFESTTYNALEIYVACLESIMVDDTVGPKEAQLVDELRSKCNIDDELHHKALHKIKKTERDWKKAVKEGKEQSRIVGEDRFGVYRKATVNYWDVEEEENYELCNGFIIFPRLRQWIYRDKENQKILCRERHERVASTTELFYDLVFVGIVRKLTHLLEQDISHWPDFIVMYTAIWLVWVNTMYYSSRFETDDFMHKVFYYWQMFTVSCLALSTSVAYTTNGTIEFAIAFIVSSVPCMFMYIYSIWHEKRSHIHQWSVLTTLIALIPWVISAIVQQYFLIFWIVGLVLGLLSPILAPFFHNFGAPVNVEHWVERQGLFVILVLGESVISLLNDVPTGVHWEVYLSVGLVLLILFCLKWIYFEGQGMPKRLHALNRNKGTAIAWTMSHWPLSVAITALGTGTIGIQTAFIQSTTTTLEKASNGTEISFVNDPAEWLFCVALGIILLIIAFHGLLSIEFDYYIINHYFRCVLRVVVGVVVILLPNLDFGIPLSGLVLIAIVAGLILLLSLIEIIGLLPNDEVYQDVGVQ